MNMIITKTIEIPLFQMSLQIVLNKDMEFEHEEYKDWVKKRVGVVLNREDEIIIVLTEYTHSAIVHECMHVVQCVRDWTGIKDDETEAYLMQWCFDKVCKLIKKNKLNFK